MQTLIFYWMNWILLYALRSSVHKMDLLKRKYTLAYILLVFYCIYHKIFEGGQNGYPCVNIKYQRRKSSNIFHTVDFAGETFEDLCTSFLTPARSNMLIHASLNDLTVNLLDTPLPQSKIKATCLNISFLRTFQYFEHIMICMHTKVLQSLNFILNFASFNRMHSGLKFHLFEFFIYDCPLI